MDPAALEPERHRGPERDRVPFVRSPRSWRCPRTSPSPPGDWWTVPANVTPAGPRSRSAVVRSELSWWASASSPPRRRRERAGLRRAPATAAAPTEPRASRSSCRSFLLAVRAYGIRAAGNRVAPMTGLRRPRLRRVAPLLAAVPIVVTTAIAGTITNPSRVRPCAVEYSKGVGGSPLHMALGPDGDLYATTPSTTASSASTPGRTTRNGSRSLRTPARTTSSPGPTGTCGSAARTTGSGCST